MKNLILLFFVFVSQILSSPFNRNSEEEMISEILKNNSSHQNSLLENIEQVQNYNNFLSAKYNSNIEKVNGDMIPFDICENIVYVGGDIQISNTIDLNLSYILDLTQNLFSILELSDIIIEESKAQEKYKSRLTEQINYLIAELKNKHEWMTSVEENYADAENQKVLNIVQNIKILFHSMKEYYQSVLSNMS